MAGVVIKLRVYGTPVPQGSVSAFAARKAGAYTGKIRYVNDNPNTKSWRQAIVDAVEPGLGWGAIPGQALAVKLVFILPRPAGHFGSGKNAAQVRPSAPAVPVVRPDLDKLCRAVLDALTDARVWADDSQVAALAAGKTYAGRDERPGVEIEVEALLREAGYGDAMSLPGVPETAGRTTQEANGG